MKFLAMEWQDQFTGFYEAIAEDPRMTYIHISMYMALLHLYVLHAGENPVQVNRESLMQFAKISGRVTYYKCLNELHEYGYIRYLPSFNYYLGSLVYLKRI
jgi:hypothetical protein